MTQCTELVAEASSAVVVKHATGVAGTARLRAEADRLQAATHPGVVELLSSWGTDDRWELRLTHGGRPLEAVGTMPVAQVARVIAATAATLADLHERGVVHGRIDATHVLVGEHGRPVLCGLGHAASGATPADDVAALGALLAAALGSASDLEPIPERRWSRRSWSGWERRSLLLIADHAAADPPTRRPTARRMAAAIAEAVPGAAVAAPAPAGPPETEFSRPVPRLPALAGALVAVTALGLGALGVVARPGSHGEAPDVGATDDRTNSAERAATAAAPTTSDLQPTTAVPPVPCVVLPAATTASGTCVEPVRVTGTTVLVGDHRFEVGQTGDVVVLGDFDCDGSATPAVLRPATGEIFVFTSWATSGALAVPSSTRIRDARDLLVEEDAAGCAVLVAERTDGSRQTVATRRPA